MTPLQKKFMMVGLRNSKPTIHWPGVIRVTLYATIAFYLAYLIIDMLLGRPLPPTPIVIRNALMCAGLYTLFMVIRLLNTPHDRLPPLD